MAKLTGPTTVGGQEVRRVRYQDFLENLAANSSPGEGVVVTSNVTYSYSFSYLSDGQVANDASWTVFPGSWTVDLSNVTSDSVNFSVNSQDTSPSGLAFSSDGTKMYIVGTGNDSVYQYSLSTAFDLSTASYDSVSLNVNSQDSIPFGMAFNTDGSKMYISGLANDTIFQYSLSTAFDLSTASYDSVSFSVSSQDTVPYGLAFNSDGTKMYMVGYANASVYQYTLSTAFDLSTASYDSVSFSVSSQDLVPIDLAFNSEGTKMYILGSNSIKGYQYTLSTGFDLSTASYDSVSFSVSSQDTSPQSFAFSTDGTKMYLIGRQLDRVYQYSTGL